MKIDVNTTFEVELDAKTRKKITEKALEEIFDIPRDAYIKDKKLVHDVEYYTSHSWFETETIREATESDILYFKLQKELKKRWKNLR